MIEMKAKTEAAAKKEAVKRSESNGGKYVLVISCFGAFMVEHKRLNVFAPTDSCFGWYALNGKVKNFTGAQVVADQIATPAMA